MRWLLLAGLLLAATAATTAELRVKHVIDGDTLIVVTPKGNIEHVRLLGINAPEVRRQDKSGEPGGAAARRWLKQRLDNQQVRLEADREAYDHYGRRLAHVFLGDVHVNRQLVATGLATANIVPPNLIYSSDLLRAQQQAELSRLGVWGNKAYQPRDILQVAAQPGRGWQRLRGVVTQVETGKRFIRLRFAKRIDVRIPRDLLSLFPDPASYVGKNLEVRGWVSRPRNKRQGYSVLIRHPANLVAL